MNHNFSMRSRVAVGFSLIGVGVLVLVGAGRSLPVHSHDFLQGFVIGLSVVVAAAGIKMWRQAAFMRRLRASASQNNRPPD